MGQLKTQQYNAIINTPIGKLGLIITNNKLAKIEFLPLQAREFSPKNPVVQQIFKRIKEYFSNPQLQFKFQLQLKGTPLQQKIWQTIQKIPCNKTITYGELAQKIATSPRVIGNACRRNPIPLVIPCHRVVAATGLGGYCGKNNKNFLRIKQWLLTHESKSTLPFN